MHTAVNHFATPEFWYHYRRLPTDVRSLADKNFALLRQDPHHPSLRLKKVGAFWSARVGLPSALWRVIGRKAWFGSGLVPTANTISCLGRKRCLFPP